MIVSHRHRFIFLKTRKTAGTSVEIALSTVCGPDDVISPISPDDETVRRARGPGAQNHESPPLPKKAFAHAPAAHVRKLVGPEVWRSYAKISVERNPWDAVVSLYYWINRDAPVPVPFDDFARSPRVGQLAQANAKTYRLRGEVILDHLCRYESLGDDLGEVWTKLGLPGSPELPHTKGQSRPAGAGYRDLFTDETAEIVRVQFAHAIRDLGYEF